MKATLILLPLLALGACNTWKGAGDDLSAGYHGVANDETTAQKIHRDANSEAGLSKDPVDSYGHQNRNRYR